MYPKEITKEQEFLGLCYCIREMAKELLHQVEHVIKLHESRDATYHGPDTIKGCMRSWIKGSIMKSAMEIVLSTQNFVREHLNDHIDIYTCGYDSEDRPKRIKK
jgi:hypothetical protein